MVWSQMKIPSFSKMSLNKSFYYELRVRKKKETESRNVGNALIKSRILLIHLNISCWILRISVAIMCAWNAIKAPNTFYFSQLNYYWSRILSGDVMELQGQVNKSEKLCSNFCYLQLNPRVWACESSPESTIFLRPSHWNLRVPFVFPIIMT